MEKKSFFLFCLVRRWFSMRRKFSFLFSSVYRADASVRRVALRPCRKTKRVCAPLSLVLGACRAKPATRTTHNPLLLRMPSSTLASSSIKAYISLVTIRIITIVDKLSCLFSWLKFWFLLRHFYPPIKFSPFINLNLCRSFEK